MSTEEFSRFDELVSRYHDAELGEADARELLAFLAEPELATRFLEMTRLNSEIAGLLAAPVPDAAMVELVRADIEKNIATQRSAEAPQLETVERIVPFASRKQRVASWR